MTQKRTTDDIRVKSTQELAPPMHLIHEYPCSDAASATVHAAREAANRIMRLEDDRLLVVVGPCSIHDPEAAVDYAHRLKSLKDQLSADLEIIMRVYFEKPRTTVGWKGLINDPDMDGSFQINKGLRIARKLLLDINEMGLATATEFLDTISPQYTADLISWGAVGARTTESQGHRELASGLSCPIGFKNGTSGDIKIAVDAVGAARYPHFFLGVTKAGISAIISTTGNDDCHIILRGGKEPNYDAESIRKACEMLKAAGRPEAVMIDVSHSNSHKVFSNQVLVTDNLCEQIAGGNKAIAGVMIESNLVEGRQNIVPDKPLTYGQSVTDACVGWKDTVSMLENLAKAVRKRRGF